MGHRAILAVPLLREGESIGAIVLRRTEAQPFSEKQIEVLQTFADQAVIAIGNVRLFEEVQARTRDLEEALHQQTATADVLKVISRSAFDLDAVLTTLLTSAFRLSEADGGTICLRDGDAYRYRSTEGAGASPQFRQFMAGRAVDLGRGSISAVSSSRESGANIRSAFRPRIPAAHSSDRQHRPSLDWGSAAQGRSRRGRVCIDAQPARLLHCAANRAGPNFRRPSRHRYREHSPVRRGSGAYARPHRGAANADRDVRCAESHQPLGVRFAEGVRRADFVSRRTLRSP